MDALTLALMLFSLLGNVAAITIIGVEWKTRSEALRAIQSQRQSLIETIEKIQLSHNAIVTQHGSLMQKVESHELRLSAISANLQPQAQKGFQR